jgi:hypothetical protein
MRYVNQLALSATNDGSSTFNGTVYDAQQLLTASFHAYFSDAAAAGTLKIQASNDVAQNGTSASFPSHWVDIPSASASVTAGSSVLIKLTDMSYRWVRAVFVASGGAGSITVNMMANST